MNAQEIINSAEGLDEQDTEELQLQATKNLTKCIKEVKNGRTNNKR